MLIFGFHLHILDISFTSIKRRCYLSYLPRRLFTVLKILSFSTHMTLSALVELRIREKKYCFQNPTFITWKVKDLWCNNVIKIELGIPKRRIAIIVYEYNGTSICQPLRHDAAKRLPSIVRAMQTLLQLIIIIRNIYNACSAIFPLFTSWSDNAFQLRLDATA